MNSNTKGLSAQLHHEMQNEKDWVSDAPKCRTVDLSIRFPLQAAELHFLVLLRSKLETTGGSRLAESRPS